MLDNEYLNYTILSFSVLFLCYVLYRALQRLDEVVRVIKDGGNKLKTVGDGVENINSIVSNNMEPISNGISNISEIVESIKTMVAGVARAFTSNQEPQVNELKKQ